MTAPQDWAEIVKWAVPITGSILIFVLTITWRVAHRSGQVEQHLALLGQIKTQTDRLPQLETTIGMIVTQQQQLQAQQQKMMSHFPKALASLDRRMTKLEAFASIEATGRYNLPPLDDDGNRE